MQYIATTERVVGSKKTISLYINKLYGIDTCFTSKCSIVNSINKLWTNKNCIPGWVS